MTNQTFSYTKGQQLRSSIKQTLPNLLKLKREENKIKFNKLLLELVPDMEKYIVKRMRTAIQQEHFPKNKYKVDDFIDQLFIEIYDQIEQFSNEYEFYVWIYKKTNELLDDAITEETFDDLFLKNIDDYSKQEWDQMREKFTAEYDGDLIMKEDLNDISYYKEAYTLKDIFIENTEDYLEAEIDEILHEEEVDKHIQIVLHNLPLPMQNVFELFTKQHLTLAEIAEIRNISIVKAQQLLNDARKSLKISLFNRYTFDSETLFIDES
ncbi:MULTISPECIES: RNA polymerase sigma factor [unclassified Polaribacter]|jgi:RNA polymerase sigma factor (sigma-70 family)|uniref:RNA polymerase sigma factor n=1 Tax=unclassified Polaribacter TaxID=196858 RepID=UPI00052B5FB6|nr:MULTISPECIES: sigma-70 family RNA polymerase sigma factor [unclassified Polaribacter]KGL59870.1 RNA polymerase sigma factor family protein [Polaribacter sp. Hel1_33_49]PKV65776.1 RNA polymerase sigma factor (sigma-70 family) [Polaribacter sp. Hel1_33_96]